VFEVPVSGEQLDRGGVLLRHTNPIFALVGGKPVRASKRSAQWCLDAVKVSAGRRKPRAWPGRFGAGEGGVRSFAREVYRQRIGRVGGQSRALRTVLPRDDAQSFFTTGYCAQSASRPSRPALALIEPNLFRRFSNGSQTAARKGRWRWRWLLGAPDLKGRTRFGSRIRERSAPRFQIRLAPYSRCPVIGCGHQLRLSASQMAPQNSSDNSALPRKPARACPPPWLKGCAKGHGRDLPGRRRSP